MERAILFLDTNILLDCWKAEDYRMSGRQLLLVVIPEVLRELRGLSRSPARGQAGSALHALALLEPIAQRRVRDGVPFGRWGTQLKVMPGTPDDSVPTDRRLVVAAKAERSRQRGAMVAVVTKDRGVADIARAEGVKSVLLYGIASAAALERGLAEHDSMLDLDL